MKPQDIVFLAILLGLLIKRKPEWFVRAGLVCLLLSIPLFAFWVFFTAQRLVYYGVMFIFVATLLYLFKFRKD